MVTHEYYIFQSYLLVMPYLALTIYFLFFQSDNFYLKTRSSVQLLYVLMILGTVFLNLILWRSFFSEYYFFKFNINGSNKHVLLATLLATVAAVSGWVFTSRVQIINAIKNQSLQVLMNSRNSTIYIDKVDKVMSLRRKIVDENKKSGISEIKPFVTEEKYHSLGDEDKSAIIYMLNYLEFISIGIRHYNLDEAFLKQSMRSIVNSNYDLFYKVIDIHRSYDNKAVYTQFELLHARWGKQGAAKCSNCHAWQDNVFVKKPWYIKYSFIVHCIAMVLTMFTWSLIILFMWSVNTFLTSGEQSEHICYNCEPKVGEQPKKAA